MKQIKFIKSVITETKTYLLTDTDFVEFLLFKGVILAKEDNISVFVRVPGGGDWSNTDLEIDDEHPVNIVVETTTEKGA